MSVRVGIVTYDYVPAKGGQGRVTQALVRELAEVADIQVSVFSPDTGPLEGLVPSGVLAARFGKHFGFSMSVALQLNRWQRDFGIDVFHFNGGPGGVLLLRAVDAPVVYTAHHTYLQQSRLVPGQVWKRLLIGAEGRGYRRSEAVVAVSEATARAVREEVGQDAPCRVTVVPNGIDCDFFKSKALAREADSVLFVGRLDERKGVEQLLSSWPRVVAQKPSARLYLIGEGHLRRQLEAYVNQHGFTHSVSFLGRVSGQELVAWYNRVSCVAVPSRFEGFGLAALEAIACGTPVVATATDGLSEVVRHGVDGYLVRPDDDAAMADAIVEEMANWPPLSTDVVRSAVEPYDWQTAAAGYADIYRAAA